jgi:hypothetical protein
MARVFRRFAAPDRLQLVTLCACAGAGALGALPGRSGALDPLTVLGWLALLAPGAGALCAGRGLALFPFALAVPGAWSLVLVQAQLRAPRALSAPLFALCALVGLFALGFAAGRRARCGIRAAGLLFYATLLLSGAATGFGLLAGGDELARTRPGAAARLLDLSPLVLVFDCAGVDWTHAQPEVYARAGVEWLQRRPYRGILAGPAVLVVGCILAVVARVPRNPHRSWPCASTSAPSPRS